ncbi:sensor histidine kinase KdpD [Hydrogenoanaerobacterium sp.]|uniref:sensor histidine kinase KdpD n=1 Tax=Hydrogenoanaerobacterium sp. TaxID=2953763 RepID=UPI0028A0A77D|nr:sensor histidine kinase KdpD [Hydrogenoanaerobacterium sp.]
MNENRPHPEHLRLELSRQVLKQRRGKLKIFFGYAAGVGKTYAMLEAGHAAKDAGVDVVAGYIEPHLRPETSKLIEGLEVIPALKVTWKGITVNEFDLDAAIQRHPTLILVDELAHTNAHGCRNLKRYQDIEELLKAGIDVYTTVNVQHIESLNDMVYRITKIAVKERIPDKVIDSADQIELVDIEPEELIARLSSGKVYRNVQAKRALQNFFTKDNLVALREIALRRTADQINNRLEQENPISKREYYTNEHILICLSSSPSNAKVIRTAARMANAFHAAFTALFVEVPGTSELSGENRDRLRANLRLAEQLGAKIATVYGDNVPEQIAEYAKAAEVSKIVIGRSNNKKRLLPQQTFVEALTQLAPDLDIFIIPDHFAPYARPSKLKKAQNPAISVLDALKSVAILALATSIGFCFHHFGFNESNIIMVYIAGVLLTSVCTHRRLYSLISSVLSVLIFNFLFTDPRFTFNAYDSGYPATFVIMFLVAMFTSSLTMRVKKQSRQNALKARSTETLLETSQRLQKAEDTMAIYHVMGEQVRKLLERTVILYPVTAGTSLSTEPIVFSEEAEASVQKYLSHEERAVAEWVLKNDKHAGATTNTLSGAKCLCLSIRGQTSAVHAVIAISMESAELGSYEKNVLISMLGEFGLSLEKEAIYQSNKEIYMKAQQEQLRANLLRAISHDLRTPLTAISGNASILMGNGNVLNADKKQQLYTDIYDDSIWLINLVENLLSLTRIDNAQMELNLQPELLDEVINEALRHINRKSVDYCISVDLADDMLMAAMDARLIIQVIINLVDNAIKYTDPGTSIQIKAYQLSPEKIAVEICDNGNGIADRDKAKIFDMFYTADKNTGDSRRGLGLGLSLCKSVINAHQGEISVRDNHPKGTVFLFTLPIKETNAYE